MTNRTITIVTANLGRGVGTKEYLANVDRLERQVPGHHRFYGFQEIDEADAPEERRLLRARLRDTHRFVGLETAVPIAVPRSWTVQRRVITRASDGIAGISPHRHVVQAVVHPDGLPECKAVAENTHFARDVEVAAKARADADEVLRARIHHWQVRRDWPSWLTADLNSANYPKLAPHGERRLVSARLDVIRAYLPAEDDGVRLVLLDTGTVDLTIDGHNAHWAKVRLEWSK